MDHKQRMLLKMADHSMRCAHQNAGGILYSFRLVQEVRTKKLHRIPQIKCTGCGHSLDYVNYGEGK